MHAQTRRLSPHPPAKPTPLDVTVPDEAQRDHSSLALPTLRCPPAVPPDVHGCDRGQHRQNYQHGAPGVATRLLVQHLEDHVLPAPNEPPDPAQNGAPNQRAQSSEQDEPAELHARDAGGDRNEMDYHGQQSSKKRADLPVSREITLRTIQRAP